jgi:hypothetical protein
MSPFIRREFAEVRSIRTATSSQESASASIGSTVSEPPYHHTFLTVDEDDLGRKDRRFWSDCPCCTWRQLLGWTVKLSLRSYWILKIRAIDMSVGNGLPILSRLRILWLPRGSVDGGNGVSFSLDAHRPEVQLDGVSFKNSRMTSTFYPEQSLHRNVPMLLSMQSVSRWVVSLSLAHVIARHVAGTSRHVAAIGSGTLRLMFALH